MRKFIFIIGYNKTATTALHGLFQASGFASAHWLHGKLAADMLANLAHGRRILHGYDETFSVFSDMTFVDAHTIIEGNEYFQRLDEDYPGARFIYNYRNVDDWVRSRRQHVNGAGELFIERYKRAIGLVSDEAVIEFWKRRRERHEARLADYFTSPGKLLYLNIDAPGIVDALNAFLGTDLDHTKWTIRNDTATRIDPPISPSRT